MDDKIEELLRQYPFQVKSKKRTRGAFLLESDQGMRLLKEYSGSLRRLEFEERIKNRMAEQGYLYADLTCRNARGEYFTKDNYRNNWIVREWHPGTECDIRDRDQILACAGHLGRIHTLMKIPSGGEGEYVQKEGIKEEMGRHNKELKRVRSYIRAKKQKNEMEICLLDSFDIFYGQACLAQTLLQESGCESLWERTLQEGRICHGSYNYHNLLLGQEEIATTNFDKAEIGIQVRDLYDFLRKVMEKNGWDESLGMRVIEEYQRKRAFEQGEGIVLYALLLYPEKYWKLVNFYYNGRKSWMPAKNLEKLVKIRSQEESRGRFLDEVRGLFI